MLEHYQDVPNSNNMMLKSTISFALQMTNDVIVNT